MISRRGFSLAVLTAAMLGLAGCAGQFRTYYAQPVDAARASTWHVTDVQVSVPQSLVVSEERTLVPNADIVWREDTVGTRYQQVDKIMTDAIAQAGSVLRGPRPVRILATVSRFHALTFEAEALSRGGVHNVDFTISVVDARTGETLAGPEKIEAAFPAPGGGTMAAARARGESQKSMITGHVIRTVRGWLGVGPDVRESFVKVGA